MRTSQKLTLLVIAGVLASATISYCYGKSVGARDVRLGQNTQRIRVATSHREQAERATLKALGRSEAAKSHRDSAKTRVVVVSDTTVRVGTLPPIVVPMPVVSLLRADDRQIRMDSLTITALKVENATLREERDSWKERAELLRPPRCGTKCGVAIGVAGTLLGVFTLHRIP